MHNDPGSFRDPAGIVLCPDNKIYRTVTEYGAEQYEFVKKSGLYEELTGQNLLVPFREVDKKSVNFEFSSRTRYLLELQKLDFISYPYEWSFSALRQAALAHLKIHLLALTKGVTLSDATAYNIQFTGTRAIFIDQLSFRRYVDGELWYGHRQFCEQFLNPLLLRILCGISHHAWCRSSLEGITASDLNSLLPWYKKISPEVFFHVTLHAWLQQKHHHQKPVDIKSRKLPITAFRSMLVQLQDWIGGLKAPEQKSVWTDYSSNTIYDSEETATKKEFVRNYTASVKPRVIWDLGCNTGEYTVCCLEAGAKKSIGFDADPDVVDMAYLNARKKNLQFLPLYMDFTNPSPSQGWGEKERGGLSRRQKPDGLLALALLHHLVIGRNIPLHEAVNRIIDLAPTGVIEFIPKNDPMVKTLLFYKHDIFPDYTEQNFMSIVCRRAKVVSEKYLTGEGRKLVFYSRPGS